MTQPLHSPEAFANVLGIGIHATNMEHAVARIRLALTQREKGYVCLAGVPGIMQARRHPDLRSIFANALMVAPDGMPTVWMGHLQGLKRMQRVFGPDLMIEVLACDDLKHCRHFLCGGTPGVAEKLREKLLLRFPDSKIVGTFSPPFHPMTTDEETAFADQIRTAKPDIIWMGISTPAQDRFMAKYLPMLETTLMIGVGAAFLYHTGALRDSPAWVKRSGLQWAHRLLQEPRRLFRRYVTSIPPFLIQAALQAAGLATYSLVESQTIHKSHSGIAAPNHPLTGQSLASPPQSEPITQ